MIRFRRWNCVPRLQISVIHTLLCVLVVPDDIRCQARQTRPVLASSLLDGTFVLDEEQFDYLIVIH